MNQKLKITGLVPATFTPMHDDGSLNLDMIPALAVRLMNQGASGLYVNGSTGEGVSMTSDERRAAAEAWVEAVEGRIPVIVQVGHNSLAEARGLAAHAQAIGATAISATPPNYFKPKTLDTLIDCMTFVAAGAPDLPYYYYHIPAVTGVDFDMVELLRLGAQRIPTLAGVKYSKPTIFEMQACTLFDGGRYNILFGSDEMLLSGLVGGAHGAVGSTYNYAIPLYQAVIAAYQAEDMVEAQRLQGVAAQLVRPIYRFGGAPALKAVMKIIGLDCGPSRLPQQTLTPAQVDALEREMTELGLFEWV
jgi:N-acetylneuraminate lyase